MGRAGLNFLRETENLARFIFARSHYSPEKKAVKYGAFLPTRNLETSVFRADGLDESQIWTIAVDVVAQGRTTRARGDVFVATVQGLELSVEPDESPDSRHADIRGWPRGKSEQKLKAIQLARKATLHLFPRSPAELEE